uniref:Transposase Helix-turn-helix domain-containing protein n=1 Tax=Strigamia maritima TaxID=126957 RepID=T1JMC0_STRMM
MGSEITNRCTNFEKKIKTYGSIPSMCLPKIANDDLPLTHACQHEKAEDNIDSIINLPDGTDDLIKITEQFNDFMDENASDIIPTSRIQECLVSKEVQVNTYEEQSFLLSNILKTDSAVNCFTGIQTIELLDYICQMSQEFDNNQHSELSLRNHIVFAMCKLKTNISFRCLAFLFNISSSTCTRYFRKTVLLLAKVLECLIVWPDKEEILANIPKCFQKYKRTRVVVDCTEVTVEKPLCLTCRILTYSHCKDTHTIKILIGVSPSGVITHLTLRCLTFWVNAKTY